MSSSVYRFNKKSDEKYPIDITYTNADGTTTYTISSMTVVAEDQDGNTETSNVIDSGSNSFSSNTASIWVQAGTIGEYYTIDVLATMTSGEKINKRLLMYVSL